MTASQDDARRDVLPIPDRPYDCPIYDDAKDPNATFAPIAPLRPASAPNVLIGLLDDVGFAASSAFGLVSPEDRFRIATARQ